MGTYRRINAEESKRLRRKYYADQLYVVLSPVLKHYCEGGNELTPVEIWTEARRLAHELALSPRPDREIADMAHELAHEYLVLSDSPTCARLQQEVERTAFMVEVSLLFMLHCPFVGQGEMKRTETIDALARNLRCHPLMDDFMSRAYSAEAEEEKQNRYVTSFDYLLDDVTEDADMTDEAKRETIGDYVDSITGGGDLMAAKQTMRALTAYSLKNDRLYDDILMKLNTWIIANDRESETNNNFYGSVGAVGSQIGNQNIDHQMVAEPQPEKLIYGRQN